MNKREAKRLTSEIRSHVNDLVTAVLIAYDEQVWKLLGYNSFEQYCEAEFEQGFIRMIPDERAQVVAELTERRMSTRGIGKAVGVSHSQVRRDRKQVEHHVPPDVKRQGPQHGSSGGVVIGIDGGRYPAKQRPKVDPDKRLHPLPDNYCEGRYSEGFSTAFKFIKGDLKGLLTNPTASQIDSIERWLERSLKIVASMQERIHNDSQTA